MKFIIIIILLFSSLQCGSLTMDDETQIMNTVCIDGIVNFSIVSGDECIFAPMMDDHYNMIRCDK